MYYTIFTEKYQPKYTKPYKEEAKLVSPVVDDIDISFSSPEIYTNKEEIDDGIETTVSPIIKSSEGIKNKKMNEDTKGLPSTSINCERHVFAKPLATPYK